MKYLILDYSGDICTPGFVAMEATTRDATVGIYRGDLGARSRGWWRTYARKNGYKLVEVKR